MIFKIRIVVHSPCNLLFNLLISKIIFVRICFFVLFTQLCVEYCYQTKGIRMLFIIRINLVIKNNNNRQIKNIFQRNSNKRLLAVKTRKCSTKTVTRNSFCRRKNKDLRFWKSKRKKMLNDNKMYKPIGILFLMCENAKKIFSFQYFF